MYVKPWEQHYYKLVPLEQVTLIYNLSASKEHIYTVELKLQENDHFLNVDILLKQYIFKLVSFLKR